MHTSHPTPLDAPLAISYRNHQKSLAYFSHLAPLVLFFFTKRHRVKMGGGRGHSTMDHPPKYAPEYSTCALISKGCFARMDA